MSLAEGDAREAVGDQAQVDGAAAAEESLAPGLRAIGRALVDVLRRAGQDIVETVLPLGDVLVVDSHFVDGGGGLLVLRWEENGNGM